MTSCLSDMRTVRPQGPTFRITQPYGLRVSYLGTTQGHCKGQNQLSSRCLHASSDIALAAAICLSVVSFIMGQAKLHSEGDRDRDRDSTPSLKGRGVPIPRLFPASVPNLIFGYTPLGILINYAVSCREMRKCAR
jgi:hypothetical protein